MWDFQKCNQKATTQKQLNRIGCLWEKNVSHLLKSVSSDIFVVVKLLANIPAYSFIIKGHTSSSPISMCVSSPTYLSSASLYPPHLSSWQRSLPNVDKLFFIFLNLILLSFFWSALPFPSYKQRSPPEDDKKRFYLSSLLYHQYTNTGWTVLTWTCTTHAE